MENVRQPKKEYEEQQEVLLPIYRDAVLFSAGKCWALGLCQFFSDYLLTKGTPYDYDSQSALRCIDANQEKAIERLFFG